MNEPYERVPEILETDNINIFDVILISGIVVSIVLAIVLFFQVRQSEAGELTNTDYAKAIIGEAANQGTDGQRAVACGIINRGYSLQGVYGFSNGLYDREPQWVKDRGLEAWLWAKNNRNGCEELIGNSNLWENVSAFGEAYWAKSDRVKKTVKIKDHQFYYERK